MKIGSAISAEREVGKNTMEALFSCFNIEKEFWNLTHGEAILHCVKVHRENGRIT